MAFIVFLGTGDADGIPALGCRCEHCEMARNGKTQPRSWASLFISDGKTNIVVDPTPELRSQLIKTQLDKEPVHGIAITHWHFEHWLGLVELHAWDRKRTTSHDAHFKVYMNEYAVFEYQQVLPSLMRSTNRWLRDRYEIFQVKPQDTFKLDAIEVTAIELDHDPPCIGFIFKVKDRYVAYVVDSGPSLPAETLNCLKRNPDILIIDNTWQKPEGTGHWGHGHMGIDEAVDLVKKISPKAAFATHIGHKNLPHEELDQVLRNSTNGIFRAAYDGLKIFL